ncbi:MAG: UbiX family flavin prenyltransferase [Nannocystaceae bacterium]
MKLVLGITGASGSLYALRALGLLRDAITASDAQTRQLTVDIVASFTAHQVCEHELGRSLSGALEDLAAHAPQFRVWKSQDYSAPFASGSNAADAVIIMPCSMSTLARIAQGTGESLLTRSCDVALKERRKLILVVRETPLSRVHLVNMLAVTDAGAIVLPATPAFYEKSRTVNDLADTVIHRALDHAGLHLPSAARWGQT